jgi:hypothetical protein
MPILDHLAGLLIHRDALQLYQGDRKGSAFPADQHEHLVLALLLSLRFNPVGVLGSLSTEVGGVTSGLGRSGGLGLFVPGPLGGLLDRRIAPRGS